MTPRDRVLAAVQHRDTDIVPYQIRIDPEPAARLDEHFGGRQWREPIVDHVAKVEVTDGRVPLDDGNGWRDAWGCVWANKGIFHTVVRPLPEPTLDGYDLPSVYTPEEHARIQAFAEANAASPNRAFCRAGVGITFFERAWALRGMEDLLVDMVENPRFADRLFDALMEWHFPAIDGLGSIPEVDTIYFGDDFGSQRGLIMGERWFRRYLKPRLKVLYERAHSHGKYVFIHSCGDNTSIFSDLIEIGVDIFHPFQPEPQDIYALKREYGKDITFNGGIGTQQLLPRGTPQQVREEIRRMLREIGRGGGFIAEPTKPIMSDVPTENTVACIEELVGQRA